jgi:FkbM family methyltransferase
MNTMWDCLQRCVDRGLDVNTVIDVGASNASWSEECIKKIPDANYLLIEAQEPHEAYLRAFGYKFTKSQYVIACAGNIDGTCYFDNSSLFGGLGHEKEFIGNCTEVKGVKIDTEIKNRELKGKYLLKLDTHGYEIPILTGARNTLKDAELVIIEAYNHKIAEECLRFYDLCRWMDKNGFYPIEIADILQRKYDGSLWQMDIFFAPKTRKEFSYNRYE